MQVYSSEDASAPQIPLTGNYTFLPILAACLVGTTGIAYGSKASAGWTEAFTATGIKAFRQGGGNQRYFRIWDGLTADDANTARHIRIRGYEAMTAISTGTGPFPTTAQVTSNGLYMRYRQNPTFSPDGGTTFNNPKWMIVADDKTCHIFVDVFNNPADLTNYCYFSSFGALDSDKDTDTYGDCTMGSMAEGGAINMTYNTFGEIFVTRSHTGAGSSLSAAIMSPSFPQIGSNPGSGTYPYPDPVTNAVRMAKLQVLTSPTGAFGDSVLRGVLRFLWDHPHGATALGYDNTFTGSGDIAGRDFKLKKLSSASAATVLVETTDTWA